MVDQTQAIDQNDKGSLTAVSLSDGKAVVRLWADPVTHRLLVDLPPSGTGITSINSDTTAAQTLAVGTAGTDFAIVDNGTGTHTFNLPTASHTNRGALSSADWDTFNAKGSGTVTTTGSPASGNLTKFSGATSVTNADLTGDVTTSGGVATTLATVNSNVGSFTNASITVNAKGLITAASSGTAPVTAISVATANGLAGSSSGGATPALTLSTTITGTLQGNGTAISASKVTLTQPATGSTLTIVDGKTLTVNNTLTLSGTDSTTMTFPSTTATIARTDAAQTFTGIQTFAQILTTPATISVSSNAGTVTRSNRINNFTNSSAATMTITISTTSAADGDMVMVVILDFSAVAQTITWVNTENSTVTAPTTSNGSTTLPLTVGFKWNAGTSKWRCIASA